MPKLFAKLTILLVVLLAGNRFTIAQNNFNNHLQKYEDIEAAEFNVYLDSVQSDKWVPKNSIENYAKWLLKNKVECLENENHFFRAYFLIELAKTNQGLNKFADAYKNIESALSYFPNKDFPEINYKILQIGRYIAISHTDYETTIQYLKDIEKTEYLKNNPIEWCNVLLDIAEWYWKLHQYDESIDYCQKVQPMVNILNYKKGKIRALIIMYNNSFFSTTDSTNTEYLDQALEIALALSDSARLSKIYFTIGLSHYRKKNQLIAIDYYQIARSFIADKGSSDELYIAIYQNLSYTLIDSVQSACKLSKYITEYAIQNNITNFLSNAFRERAWCFAKRGIVDSASYYLEKAHYERQLLTEKSKSSPGFYYYLYEVAIIIDDYQSALKYLNISSSQTKRISRETNTKKLSKSRAEYDYQIQRERIEKLTFEFKLEKEKRKTQRIINIGITLLLILGITFLIFARRKYTQLQISFQELVRKNIELDKLNARLSISEESLKNKKNGNLIKDEEKIYLKLKELFEKEKIYKQHDISLRKLAKKLRTNTSYISAIVNNRFNESFNTLINRYRINEVRRLFGLSSFSKYSIEGIAEEVG